MENIKIGKFSNYYAGIWICTYILNWNFNCKFRIQININGKRKRWCDLKNCKSSDFDGLVGVGVNSKRRRLWGLDQQGLSQESAVSIYYRVAKWIVSSRIVVDTDFVTFMNKSWK